MAGSALPYQCFISYARDDDKGFDQAVQRLRTELASRFEAVTGSQLEVFLDRDSIGWGENWRTKITDAIAGSTLFIPILTMRYFNRPMCRDELSTFREAAIQRGASDLVLPIILAGEDQITANPNGDELIRAISELNWQSIEKAWESGYESSAWKQAVGRLVDGLWKGLQRAQVPLSQSEQLREDGQSTLETIDEQVLVDHFTELGGMFEAISPAMTKLSEAFVRRLGSEDLANVDTRTRTRLLSALAVDIAEPARAIGALGAAIEAKTTQLDSEYRALIAEMTDIDSEVSREQGKQLRANATANVGQLTEFLQTLEEAEKTLRMAALANVNLRKALRPLTDGIRSLATATEVMTSWSEIGPEAA